MRLDDKDITQSDLDAKMQRAIEEENKREIEKQRKRKHKRNLRHAVLIAMVTVISVAGAVTLIKYLSPNYYKNDEEFHEFADESFTTYELCPHSGNETTEYNYGEYFSSAVRRDGPDVTENIKRFRENKINAIMSADSKEASDSDDDLVRATLIDASVFKTGTGGISMVINHCKYKQDKRDLVFEGSEAETYLFNEQNGATAEPLQVLNVNYKDKVSEYAEEYFTKYYNDEDRSENWKKYLTADDGNYNKFVMTGDEIIFIFDEDTVLTKDKGISAVSMPYKLISSAIRPELLNRYIDPSKPMVALTYDDGPGGDSEAKILRALEANGSVATFFYLGNRVSAFSENAVKAVQIGCEIGNHSWNHPMLSKLKKKEVQEQMSKTNGAIREVCGVDPVVARPPYGDCDNKTAKTCNMAEVLWTVDTQDWKTRNSKKIVKAVQSQKNLDGQIILMHSIYDETAKATEKIVPWLKKKGYQTVTVSELIEYKTGKSPEAGKLYRNVK